MSPKRLQFASAASIEKAKVVVIGANTNAAGTIPHPPVEYFSGDCLRDTDNEFPALPEGSASGFHRSVFNGSLLFDAGNLVLDPNSPSQQREAISRAFSEQCRSKRLPIFLGGDHFVKTAVFDALQTLQEEVFVLYLDAHPDCLQEERITFFSILHHAFLNKVFTPKQVEIFGLRQVISAELEGLERWKPPVTWSRDLVERSVHGVVEDILKRQKGRKYLYISIDMDGISPHDAPAVEGIFPGGPSVDQWLFVMSELAKNFKLVGMDCTEFLTNHPGTKLTALSVARIVKEFYRLNL